MSSIKAIPLELINVLMTNHNGMKKSLMAGVPINIQQKTKDVLMHIKKANGLSSASNAIDLLIATVSLYQLNDENYKDKYEIFDKEQLSDIKTNKGVSKTIIVDGKELYSIASACRFFKISRGTVLYRIKNTKSHKFRGWNFSDEDVSIKYRNK